MRTITEGQKQKYKILIMAILLAGACLLTYYFHTVLEIASVFTHLFYIPIILACVWWEKKGLAVPIFLAALLSISYVFIKNDSVTVFDHLRSLMFLSIGFVTATLSEKTAKEQKKSDHLNAVLNAIRNVNQLIIREKDRSSMLQGVCTNLIKTRGYYNAWIALFDESRKLVNTVEAGLGKDFTAMVELFKRGELVDCAQRALGQSEVVAIKNPSSECPDCPLSDKYPGRGGMTIRLQKGEKIYGLMVVSIPVDLIDDGEERTLLKEIAGDIAFALHSIEAEERKREAEEALRESEEKYRSLVESSIDAILMMDVERKIVSSNQAFLDQFGYTRDEVEGRSTRIIYKSDESFRYFGEKAYPAIESSDSYRAEWEFMRKDGSTFPVETITSVIKSPDGLTRGYVAVMRDFSARKQTLEEKKRLEVQLQQAQKMEAIGTLAGGIAHDFNNILFPIIGYTEMVMDDVQEDSVARSNLEQVLKAANRATDLVRQILAFSRQSEQELKPLRIQLLMKEILKLLRASLPSTIEIRHNIDNKCGPVMADPTQMHQLIMNLCTNAYHAMREKGGVLEVILTEVELDSDDLSPNLDLNPGTYLKLIVSDTGHGMDRIIMERIFEPFFTTKDPGEGTGMGLSIVHGVVKSHGGRITVYSEPGEGTTFQVYLPRIDIEGTEREITPTEPVPLGKERILFVDDEVQIVQMMQQMLESLGYHVTARTSSIEALEAFHSQPDKFDLILTDQTMPNMTGAKLAEKLIEVRPDIPIILFTGFSERITEENAKTIGIRQYVMKPVVRGELARAIRRVLDQEEER